MGPKQLRMVRHISRCNEGRINFSKIKLTTFSDMPTKKCCHSLLLFLQVHINPAYQSRELIYCLNKVAVKCMVIAETFKTSNYYQMMIDTCPEIQTCDPGKIRTKVAPNLTSLITIPSTQQKFGS